MARNYDSYRITCVRTSNGPDHFRTADCIGNIIICTLFAERDLDEFIPYHLLEHRTVWQKRNGKISSLAIKIFLKLHTAFYGKRMIDRLRVTSRITKENTLNTVIGTGDLQYTDR